MTQVQLLGPVDIRRLAEELDIRPTKKLGQNFVHDPNTVRRIVAAAELGENEHVVEVGPGLGSLTLGLLEVAERVTAVEIDPRLAGRLGKTVAEFAPERRDGLRILTADALTLSPDSIEAPTALVANLPYNVSVPVLLHFLAIFPSIRRVLVMVQAEVADRLSSSPGTRMYGVPSVKASFYGTVRRAGAIGRNVFWPAPNIDSGLVRIDCYDAHTAPWDLSDATRARMFPLVDAAFAQRRKTLRAALSKHLGSGARAEEILREAGVDPTLRGEKLQVEDFLRIADAAQDSPASQQQGADA